MESVIVGVYKFEKAIVVHCLSANADGDGNRKVDKVFLKPSDEKAEKCVVGTTCYVGSYQYNNKFYNYIKF